MADIEKDSNGPGEVYIVQTRQSVDHDMNVFKYGRAKSAITRLKGYPKGTEIVCRLPVSRMKDAEDMMKILCRTDLLPRPDFGCEYFEGDLLIMIKKLIRAAENFPVIAKCWPERSDVDVDVDVLAEYELQLEDEMMEELETESLGQMETDAETNERSEEKETLDESLQPCEIDQSPLPSSIDPTILMSSYIQANMQEFSKQPVDTARLLDDVTAMLHKAGCKRKSNPSFLSLSHQLKRCFGTTEIQSHKFPDGVVRHATVFKSLIKAKLPEQSKLKMFFEMGERERGCSIIQREGEATWLTDFKTAFEAKMGKGSDIADLTVFSGAGFGLSLKKINVCLACKRPPSPGGRYIPCCGAYKHNIRAKKTLIYNMVLTEIE